MEVKLLFHKRNCPGVRFPDDDFLTLSDLTDVRTSFSVIGELNTRVSCILSIGLVWLDRSGLS